MAVVLIAVCVVLAVVAAFFLSGLLWMLAWNLLLVPITGWPEISIWYGMLFGFVISVIFGGRRVVEVRK
jgi:hypothetical protein